MKGRDLWQAQEVLERLCFLPVFLFPSMSWIRWPGRGISAGFLCLDHCPYDPNLVSIKKMHGMK